MPGSSSQIFLMPLRCGVALLRFQLTPILDDRAEECAAGFLRDAIPSRCEDFFASWIDLALSPIPYVASVPVAWSATRTSGRAGTVLSDWPKIRPELAARPLATFHRACAGIAELDGLTRVPS
jgi:hypothetical protein